LPVQQAIVTRRNFGRNVSGLTQRHSNPPALQSAFVSERLEVCEVNDISSSVDNLAPTQKFNQINDSRLMPKKTFTTFNKNGTVGNWQVDNGWKFMGNDDVNMESSDVDDDGESSDWAATKPNLPLSPFSPVSFENRSSALEKMISKQFPNVRHSASSTDEEFRMSAYDNVDDKRIPKPPPSEISEITEFSDAWNEITPGITETESENNSKSSLNTCVRSKSFKDRLDPLMSTDRLSALRSNRQDSNTVGSSIRSFALDLAQQKSTTFAQNIENFIQCTCDSKETNPQVVMRNMRQFMSGMKNYLVKHGEKGFDKEVERERNKLKCTEFLNLDAILEGVMHRLVVTPLKPHLDKLFMNYYSKSGALELLADNVIYANTRPPAELAIKPKLTLPSEIAIKTIEEYLQRLQRADSPLEKLEYLLTAIATIFNSVKTATINGGKSNSLALGADDFLPLFVWVLVKTKFVTAEIEAEYMWGLLHPSLLSGEGGYYLTTLSSAVHVLKNFKSSTTEERISSIPKSDCVLKVVVPNEMHGSILTKTLPVRPHMTTKDVCKIIAHKARITNPQDYALYKLVNGEETILTDNECPQELVQRNDGQHVTLAYKRIDAKIAWPRNTSH